MDRRTFNQYKKWPGILALACSFINSIESTGSTIFKFLLKGPASSYLKAFSCTHQQVSLVIFILTDKISHVAISEYSGKRQKLLSGYVVKPSGGPRVGLIVVVLGLGL